MEWLNLERHWQQKKEERKNISPVFFVVELDERLIDDAGDRPSGVSVEDADQDRHDGQAPGLQAVAVVDVAAGGRVAADVVVRSVCTKINAFLHCH
jgi:hypothetical protein